MAYLDRKVINCVSRLADPLRVGYTFKQCDSSAQLGYLPFLLFKLESLLLNLFVGYTLPRD